MAKLIMWNLLSLDGSYDSDQPWELSWHLKVWGDELQEFSLTQLRTAGMLLFGRKTYEGMAAYWASETGEIADFMNSLPKAVVSRTLSKVDWAGTRILSGDLREEIEGIKASSEGDIYVFGSGELCQSLMALKLFDEYRIGIAPVIEGSGRRLFANEGIDELLHLEEMIQHSTGCVILRYSATGV
ncbi:MAG: dihydrofolate reductase family protein [Armatimonadetes bacterium]|nr:dihydrofolate reductase family protein [Armatimonadota bacterium]